MACFLVPTAEAVVVTVAASIIRSKERKQLGINFEEKKEELTSTKLFSLTKLLYGGSGLLAFEHLWHGEISPVFPFLTACKEGDEAVTEMLTEMGTVGVTMAIVCTVAWGALLLIKKLLKSKQSKLEVVEGK